MNRSCQLVTMNPGSQIGPPTLIERKYPLPDGGEGTDLYLTKEGFETAFARDVPKRIADQMWATQRPFSQEAFAVAVRPARLEDDPVVVSRGHPGPRDPARDPALHG